VYATRGVADVPRVTLDDVNRGQVRRLARLLARIVGEVGVDVRSTGGALGEDILSRENADTVDLIVLPFVDVVGAGQRRRLVVATDALFDVFGDQGGRHAADETDRESDYDHDDGELRRVTPADPIRNQPL